MPVLSQLQTYIAGAVAALCILIGAALGWYAPWVGGRAQVHKAQAATHAVQALLDRSSADLATCHANTANLSGAIDTQNKAVEALRVEGDRRTAAATQAAQAARAVAESYRVRASAVMASTVPTPSNACAAADALILGSLK